MGRAGHGWWRQNLDFQYSSNKYSLEECKYDQAAGRKRARMFNYTLQAASAKMLQK